jgi:hypothetical protein
MRRGARSSAPSVNARRRVRRLGRRLDAETRQREALELSVVAIGVALTIGLFWKAP